MGIAAYDRGTQALRRQIEAEQPSHHQKLFADLNAGRTGQGRLFQDTVIRIDAAGRFWLMDRPEEGWASYGMPFQSLREILAVYAVHLVGLSRDQHSAIIPVIALAEGGRR